MMSNGEGASLKYVIRKRCAQKITAFYRNVSKKYKHTYSQELMEKNVNNSSSVIRFNLGMHTMVCPGDIEQEGLKAMSAYLPYPLCCFADIYIVSHHGSLNGHPICIQALVPPFFGKGKQMPWYTLVLGRDKAYNGIFSPKVMNDFNTVSWLFSTDVSSTGQTLSFVMIDWQSGKVTNFKII